MESTRKTEFFMGLVLAMLAFSIVSTVSTYFTVHATKDAAANRWNTWRHLEETREASIKSWIRQIERDNPALKVPPVPTISDKIPSAEKASQ